MGVGEGCNALSDAVFWRRRVTKQNNVFGKIVARDNDSYLIGLTRNIFQLVRKQFFLKVGTTPSPPLLVRKSLKKKIQVSIFIVRLFVFGEIFIMTCN